MSKKRVLEHGMQRRGFVTVDDEATKGAVVGENVYNADGTLFNPSAVVTEIIETIKNSNPNNIARTLWRLILEIPANIVNLAALNEIGFATRISDSSEWANREIFGTFGRIEVSDGDGVGSELNTTLNSGEDIALNIGGNARLNSFENITLNSGVIVTLNLDGFATLNDLSSGNPIIQLGAWPTVQNSIDSDLTYTIHLGEQLIVYDSFDIEGTLNIDGDLVIL